MNSIICLILFYFILNLFWSLIFINCDLFFFSYSFFFFLFSLKLISLSFSLSLSLSFQKIRWNENYMAKMRPMLQKQENLLLRSVSDINTSFPTKENGVFLVEGSFHEPYSEICSAQVFFFFSLLFFSLSLLSLFSFSFSLFSFSFSFSFSFFFFLFLSLFLNFISLFYLESRSISINSWRSFSSKIPHCVEVFSLFSSSHFLCFFDSLFLFSSLTFFYLSSPLLFSLSLFQ